jgi:hypothetical protein
MLPGARQGATTRNQHMPEASAAQIMPVAAAEPPPRWMMHTEDAYSKFTRVQAHLSPNPGHATRTF